MNAPSVVDWAARALVAAWRRQEFEGRYRGADDFRGLHIDATDALASWRAAIGPDAPWPAELAADFAAVQLLPELGLDDAERLVTLIAVAVELEPRLRPLTSALADDATTRSPTVALVVELAGAVGLEPADVRAACSTDRRPVRYDLVRVVTIDGRPSGLDAVVVPTEWLVATAAGCTPGTSGLRFTSAPDPGRPSGDLLALRGADHVRHAEWVAPFGAVVDDPSPTELGAFARDARRAGALLVIGSADVPSPQLVAAATSLASLGSRIAVSTQAPVQWVPPPEWTVVDVPPLPTSERVSRWAAGLADRPATLDIEALARDYALGAGAVDDALQRAARSGDPRAAARATAWQDLTAVARPGRSGAGWDDLVVPPTVRDGLREIAAAIGRRRIVLDDWHFGARPGGRGYHVLFAGPSGTGKTLAASVIADEVGLELWMVDLARVVDKYLGETEKLLDRVLRAAEVSGAMLLFDEAEALFGRRGEVREARDRWANVEVAYLLQRIEQHDGVTVLTSNVSHHIDEAFARRMSQRIDFPVPDAPLRRTLWRRSLPSAAPLGDPADLDVVGDRFELAGGAIRNAAINAAYAAAGDGDPIMLRHLVRASVGELVKAGRAPTRADLGELAVLDQR